MSSRQAQDQAKRVAAGLCALCGAKRPAGLATLCRAHQERVSARNRRKRGCKPWVPGGRGRPPEWYHALVRSKGKAHAQLEALRRNAPTLV